VPEGFAKAAFFVESRNYDRDFQERRYYTILDIRVTSPSRCI
jgi:hypothetical protein